MVEDFIQQYGLDEKAGIIFGKGPTRMGEGSYHWTGCDIWRCLGLFWSLRPYNTLVEDAVSAGNKLKDFWLCIGF
jgi:hypothetical protein